MPRFKKGRDLKRWKTNRPNADVGKLRIVGGIYGGRQISYSGDPVTRPMKDDIREAVFNLIGGWTPGTAAIDLFAGTGAMGLEAISRGATQAFFVERHFPTVRIINENIQTIAPEVPTTVSASDSFFWARKFLTNKEAWPVEPWLVICCPPYDLYLKSDKELLDLITNFKRAAPEGSLIVVESDSRFDVDSLPDHDDWVVRNYTPAVISIFKKFDDESEFARQR